MELNTSKRRIFIANDNNYFQICSFNQHKNGDIYFSTPDEKIKLMGLGKKLENSDPEIFTIDASLKDEHLSIHKDGRAHISPNNSSGSSRLIIRGNYLRNVQDKKNGIRHLFTTFFKEPTFISSSVFNERQADYLMKIHGSKPFFVVFFAVPRPQFPNQLHVNIGAQFSVQDLERIPPEMPEISYDSFCLGSHSVVWYCYRTKNMDNWPGKTIIYYHEGFFVPFFVGQKPEFRVEIRAPLYKLENNELTILMH